MKKRLVTLMAVFMIFSFSGNVFAQSVCHDCEKTSVLNVKCPEMGEQSYSGEMCPFDYDDLTYYYDKDQDGAFDKNENGWCYDRENESEYAKIQEVNNRIIIDICECEKQSTFKGNIQLGSQIGIYMEILTPGVYWAENTNSIPFTLYPKTGDLYCKGETKNESFKNIVFYQQDGKTEATPVGQCTTGLDIVNKARKLITPNIESAYEIDQDDIDANSCNMWVDIPRMIINPGEYKESYKGKPIQISVGIFNDFSNPQYLCEDIGRQICKCTRDVAMFCCDDANENYTMLFPYFTDDGMETDYWSGIAITNLNSTAGEATLTIYETDGDIGTAKINVEGNSVKAYLLRGIPGVTLTSKGSQTGAGTLFDQRCYIRVETDFNADGFAMISDNAGNGASMGYLPRLGK